MSDKQFRALGINIFGGGFTLGVLRHGGFKITEQYEECDAGAKTFDLNKRYFEGIHRPLRFVDWDPFIDHRHFIYANPPCAPWSSANTRTGMTADIRRQDPRLAMTARTMETAMSLRPDFFALETVARGYSMGRAYYDGWAEKWLNMGYGVTYYLTDALLIGVPSTRQRFHFLAHRNECDIPDMPDLTNFIPRTVRSVIGDIEYHFGHLPQHMPRRMSYNAHRLCHVVKEGRLLNGKDDIDNKIVQEAVAACEWRPSFLNRKLVYDAPGFTVVNLEQHVHPKRARFLTWREGMRIAGYPDDFVVAQPQGATQAVLPPVGQHIAQIAHESIADGKSAQRELRLVDHRDAAKPFRPGFLRTLLEENAEEEL